MEEISEITQEIYEKNTNYIERCIDTIYKHFKDTGHTWGFKEEGITRSMIDETIIDLINTIVESDEKIGCDEAGTGGIIVRLEFLDEGCEESDLTILLGL